VILKKILIIILVFVAVFVNASEHFPVPAHTANRLFYIQRSNNSNCVIYDANLLKNSSLNAENPVHTYWIRYAEGGKVQELSAIQRSMAYGLHFENHPKKAGQYVGHFLAYKKRKFIVTLDREQKPVAFFPINGKMQILEHVWVQVDEDGLFPKIHYIELFGRDAQTGAKVYEKFKP
jgi:hypothetical protein